MRISEYAVKNYQFTLVIFIMIIVLGVSTIMTMPRSEDPEMEAPFFPVVVIYPGTSPQDMEELVVEPMEERISELEDIKRIKSSINDGVAVIQVEYKYSSNFDDKYQELLREVNSMRAELPQDIVSIDVQKMLPSNVNVIQAALISENASYEKLEEQANRLEDELEKVKALKNIEIHGLPEREVKVDLELEKMARIHIPLTAVIGNIQSELANIPAGSIDAGNKSFNIKTSGNYRSIEEIRNTIVYSVNGRNIMLKDIACVDFAYEDARYITRLNGYRSVFIVAAQKPGENISKTQEEYLPVITNFKKSLPANMDLVHHFDQADNVNKRLGGLGTDFIIAILLVAITLLPLGGRAAVVVMISIPLSLAIGIVLLNVAGYNLNQLSIVGLVVALGLLVDDSIVVVENIERWMRAGYSRMEATLKATKQIGLAVLGCTVTLIIAFLPLVFLPEASGDFIRSLPLAVIFSVLASMVVSLTIIPFLSSRLLREHEGSSEGNIFMRGLKKLISGTYSLFLDKALNKPVITLLVAGAIFAGSLMLVPVIGFSLFPESEKPQFIVNIESPVIKE